MNEKDRFLMTLLELYSEELDLSIMETLEIVISEYGLEFPESLVRKLFKLYPDEIIKLSDGFYEYVIEELDDFTDFKYKIIEKQFIPTKTFISKSSHYKETVFEEIESPKGDAEILCIKQYIEASDDD